MGLALPFSGVCSLLQDAVRLRGVVFKALFKRSFSSSSSFSPSHHTVAAQNSSQFSRLPLWLHAFVCVLFSARNVLTTPSPSGEYTLVLCWPFSDTACFLLALLTFPGSSLHPHLHVYHDNLLFCSNMYSSRTKTESCEFSVLNTHQNQCWNSVGMENSTNIKHLLKPVCKTPSLLIL